MSAAMKQHSETKERIEYMAKALSTPAAKAVAKIKESPTFVKAQKWGVWEHLAFLRYLVADAIGQAEKNINAAQVAAKTPEEKAKAEKMTLEDEVNSLLKATFKDNPEIAYASNFQKLLVALNEIPKEASASEEYV